MRCLPLLLCFLLPACAQEVPPAKLWGLAAVEAPIVTEGRFAIGAEMSGGATLDGAGCLLVSNETRCAQIGTLTRNPWRLAAGTEIPLIPPQGEAECDFEAVAVVRACLEPVGTPALQPERTGIVSAK